MKVVKKGDNSQDTSYARVGVKGETQINPELTGYGQFELDWKHQTDTTLTKLVWHMLV